MPIVRFTPALKRFFPNLGELEVSAGTVSELVKEIGEKFPGLPEYIVDDHGALRHHVNIFVGNEIIKDKVNLADEVGEKDEVFIIQALSGG